MYPFQFKFEIVYTLKDRSLVISHQITNLDIKKPLYISLGGHPAFNVPLYEGETYEDYYLELTRNRIIIHLLNEEGLITEKTAEVTRDDNKIQLHKNLFDQDALIFKNINSKRVALKSKKTGPILTVEYNDFRHLGIWAKPAAPFVCIEPWLGYADVEGTTKDLKTKEGIMELMPSKVFSASYAINIA